MFLCFVEISQVFNSLKREHPFVYKLALLYFFYLFDSFDAANCLLSDSSDSVYVQALIS